LSAKTPGAWLTYLEKKLVAQQREIDLYERYYNGEHRLAFATLKFRQSFGYLFRALADIWCEIVVDAPVERLFVEGFRFGKDEPADTNAWDIWQANGLDSESVMAHTEAVKDGRSYILIGPDEHETGYPQITVEHASQVVVEHAPGNRRIRLAALKKWRDDDGYEYATLYLPDRIWKWETKEPSKYPPSDGIGKNWVPRAGEESGRNHTAPSVPMIPLYNNPTMLGDGRSDLMPAIPLQDAINKEVADMLVASEFAAFQQRVITGLQVDSDPNDPEAEAKARADMEQRAAVNRIWAVESPEAKVFSLPASDLGNYTKAIELLLQHLAAQTRTPPHYLLGQMVNVSGDALKAAETGLVAKVKRKQIDFSDSWEEAIRLALKLKGGEQPDKPMNAETIWRDPEYRSEGEQVDAALKLRALAVPLEALWERIGASPQQVEDWAKKLDLPERTASVDASGEIAAARATAPAEPALPAVSVTERSQT
jgi:hypothetical protein